MQAICGQYESSKWSTPSSDYSTLYALPAELLAEIFKHLGWEDVLVIRRTCKLFFDISTSWSLWVRLFYRLSSELWVPPVLERPISAYTAGELEYVVMRRISSEIRWMSGAAPRTRNLSTPDPDVEVEDEAVLLEGGRWLLTTTHVNYGRVYAYDLDILLFQEPRCIIDLEIDRGDRVESAWLLHTDMVQNTSTGLAFNLCLTPRSTIPPLGSPTEWPLDEIHIYRLTLKGRGSKAILEAHKIKSLRNDLRAFTEDAAFHGNYLVRRLQSVDSPFCRFEVCNWLLSDSAVHFKSYVEGDPDFCETLDDLLLIPDDKLIIISHTGISLYSVSNLHRTSAGKTKETVLLHPYWKLEYTSVHRRLSRWYLDSYAIRVAVIVDGVICGLSIPSDSDISPWFRRISDTKIAHTPVTDLGMGKLYAYDSKNEGEITMLNFLWPGDEDATGDVSLLLPAVAQSSEHRHNLPYQWLDAPLFEESSNRILSFANKLWVVVDFAYK